MNVRFVSAAAGAIALATASPAGAVIFIDATPPFPPNPDENVLLTGGGAPSTTVQGVTNQTGALIDFLGAENLLVAAQGQARITAEDGGFTLLDIRPNDATTGFDALAFNVDALADGTVTFTLYDQTNTAFTFNETLDKSGGNFFSFTTDAEQLITRAVLSSSVDVADVGQVRLTPAVLNDGGGPGGGLVPEPATWMMMIAGFFGAGAVLRSRRQRLPV